MTTFALVSNSLFSRNSTCRGKSQDQPHCIPSQVLCFLSTSEGNDKKSACPVRFNRYVRLKHATELTKEAVEGDVCRTMSRTVDILLYILFIDGGTGVCSSGRGLSHVHSNQIQDKGSCPGHPPSGLAECPLQRRRWGGGPRTLGLFTASPLTRHSIL
jgi:hypothetical protein